MVESIIAICINSLNENCGKNPTLQVLTFPLRNPLFCDESVRGNLMRYTVNKLAKISGISSRTLRFYDEIGLLKPAYYGDNNYRYYEEEQLMMLQQILFFRELGFPLIDIQSILGSQDFDKIEALKTHKYILQKKLESTEVLIKTIDKTIAHLKGNVIMNDIEMYAGFYEKKQKEYENCLLDNKIITEHEIKKLQEKIKYWKKEDWEAHQVEADELINEFLVAQRNGLQPSHPEVQAIVLKHHNSIKSFWTPSKKNYIDLGQLYQNNPEFKIFYEAYDPELIDYIFKAIQIFADSEPD